MCTNFKSISCLSYDTKNVKTSTFTSFRDLLRFSQFYFSTDFDDSKSVIGSFFVSLRKPDLKTCITALNLDFFV